MTANDIRNSILALVPKTCPKCGSPLVLSEDLEHLTCTNKACGGKLARSVEIFAKTLGIENIGSKAAQNIVETLGITAPWEIFELAVCDFEMLPRTSAEGARKMYERIHAVKEITMAQFVKALQFNRVGDGNAQTLAEKYATPVLSPKAEHFSLNTGSMFIIFKENNL